MHISNIFPQEKHSDLVNIENRIIINRPGVIALIHHINCTHSEKALMNDLYGEHYHCEFNFVYLHNSKAYKYLIILISNRIMNRALQN